MDIIYSRKRRRFPKIKIIFTNKKIKKIIIFLIIVSITILTFYNAYKAIMPAVESLSKVRVRKITTDIINDKSSEALEKIEYSDIVRVEKSEVNNINVLKTDTTTINKIASSIEKGVSEELEKISDESIEMKLGVITGSKYLSGIGPSIKIGISPSGNINTEIRKEFEAKGINQTLYRIYLKINCDVKIILPYETISENIGTEILLVETVIVGEIPENYYNFEDITTEDMLNFAE